MQFLEQLFAVLRRSGVLRSQRGVKGGYSFARHRTRSPSSRSSSSSTAPSAARPRASSPTRPRRPATYSAATIADVIEREVREAGAAMYYI